MIPASIRNNNPGAMEPGPSSKRFGSTSHEVLRWKGPDGKTKTNRIATFATPQHGAAAQFHLLSRKYTGKPLAKAVETWCGGYWSGEYAGRVEKACGLKGTDILTREIVADAARAIPIAKAMARTEAGREFPLDDEGWRTAHAMAFGDGMAPAPSPDNDVPFPKPEATARETVAAATKAVTAATTVATAAGGAATVATTPTDTITKATEAVTSATGLGEAVAAAVKFAAGAPLIVAVSLGCGALVLFWPKIKERIS